MVAQTVASASPSSFCAEDPRLGFVCEVDDCGTTGWIRECEDGFSAHSRDSDVQEPEKSNSSLLYQVERTPSQYSGQSKRHCKRGTRRFANARQPQLSSIQQVSSILLDISDRVPFSGVKTSNMKVWSKFDKKTRACSTIPEVLAQAQWFLSQVKPTLVTEEWTTTKVVWKDECHRCVGIKHCKALVLQLESHAIDWRAVMNAWTRERTAAASNPTHEDATGSVDDKFVTAREVCTPDGKRRFKWISKDKTAIPGLAQPMKVSLLLSIPADDSLVEQGFELAFGADPTEEVQNGSQTEDSDGMYEDPSESLTEECNRDEMIADEDLWGGFGGKDPEVESKTPATIMASLSEGMSPVVPAPIEAAVCSQAGDAEKNEDVGAFMEPAGMPDDSSLEKETTRMSPVKMEGARELMVPWPQSLAAGNAGVVIQGQEVDDFNAPLFEQAAFW